MLHKSCVMIVEAGGFDIYTFNYTNLKNIAKFCAVKIDSSKITHVHGSLENDSIILGILTDPDNQIYEQYSFMYKDNSRFYMYQTHGKKQWKQFQNGRFPY